MSSVSYIDLIQQDLEDVAKLEHVFITVDGYEKSGLAIKYRYPESGKVLDNIATKIERETKDKYLRGLNVGMDTMILLCDGIYVKPEGVDDYVQFDPEETGEALTFSNPSLATYIKLEDEQPTARKAVRKLFGNNEIAILNHANKLGRWINNTKADLETELWQQMGGM